MQLTISSFPNNGEIPAEFALCIPVPEGHVTFAPNRNPHLSWSDVPEGARSLAIIVTDLDAPSVGDDVNVEDRTVPYDLPRADFYHWVLVDIPPSLTELAAGIDSQGVTPHGKTIGKTDYGLRGINDYTSWFAGDEAMEGSYGGYDGPCPPWNDERVHRYIFKLYALDVPTLGLSGEFGGGEALAAMEGHILAEAEWMGTYAIYADAR